MVKESELLKIIDDRFNRIEDKLDRSHTRANTRLVLWITIFIFVLSGCFAYTSRIEAEMKYNSKRIESLEDDVSDIDGALSERFDSTAVFGEAKKRLRKLRGAE